MLSVSSGMALGKEGPSLCGTRPQPSLWSNPKDLPLLSQEIRTSKQHVLGVNLLTPRNSKYPSVFGGPEHLNNVKPNTFTPKTNTVCARFTGLEPESPQALKPKPEVYQAWPVLFLKLLENQGFRDSGSGCIGVEIRISAWDLDMLSNSSGIRKESGEGVGRPDFGFERLGLEVAFCCFVFSAFGNHVRVHTIELILTGPCFRARV